MKKLTLKLFVVALMFGGVLIHSLPVHAAYVVNVPWTWCRQYWNLDGNQSFIKE